MVHQAGAANKPKGILGSLQHPIYTKNLPDMIKFRATMTSGRSYVETYLIPFSKLESQPEFDARKKITPIPAYAKSAIIEVSNNIFQRLPDVKRQGGPESYKRAIKGENGGVDLTGQTMNGFIGGAILVELLSMSRVGIFIDKPRFDKDDVTLAETIEKSPYLYIYKAEDILNWTVDHNNQLTSVLLRDNCERMDTKYNLPCATYTRFRYIRFEDINNPSAGVRITIHDHEDVEVDTVLLEIDRIPFVMPEISESLLTDTADYQIALLNMESSDVNYSLKSNYPFYVEQYQQSGADFMRAAGDAVPGNEPSGGTAASASEAKTKTANTGATSGRRYGKGLDAPKFINPSSEPLVASMQKQEQMKAAIRQLVHLSVNRLTPIRASADSKQEDDKGLVAGLSAVGQELEHTERQIANIWSAYEKTEQGKLFVTYPSNYELRSDVERQLEADRKLDNLNKVPSVTFQKELVKDAAVLLLSQRLDEDTLAKIMKEIDAQKIIIADPKQLLEDLESGIVDRSTASTARLYPEDSVDKAREEHLERLTAITIAQTKGGGEAANLDNPGARGAPDLDDDPKVTAKGEKRTNGDTDV